MWLAAEEFPADGLGHASWSRRLWSGPGKVIPKQYQPDQAKPIQAHV
jgi:hypothetical protein